MTSPVSTPDLTAPATPTTWRSAVPMPLRAPRGVRDWLRVMRRGGATVLILLLGVVGIVPLRGIERLMHGARRPWTGPYVQGICRLILICIGIHWRRTGARLRGPGAVVANHSSWLDILALNAALPVFFVSKAEVAAWPGINILTRLTNTHFVIRDPRQARAQADAFAARIRAGHRLLFFPEGTSTDGQRVLPFKATLFQGFLDPDLPAGLSVQPVTVRYRAPVGQDDRFYGWWSDMALGPHLLHVLSVPRQGGVTITLHAPVPVAGQNRKTLSSDCQIAIEAGFRRPAGAGHHTACQANP